MTPTADEGRPPSPVPPPEGGSPLPEAEEASTALDRAMIVAEVMDYVVKVSKPTPLQLPRPRVWIPLMALLSICFAMYSYAVRPAWIWGPQPDPNAIAATHDADMRFAMFLLAQQILQYRRSFGVVPPSLADIGQHVDSVKYVRLTDTSFSLRYEATHPIILYSTQSLSGFLRNSVNVVTAGKPR